MNITRKLKPCPFCLTEPSLDPELRVGWSNKEHRMIAYVKCYQCGIEKWKILSNKSTIEDITISENQLNDKLDELANEWNARREKTREEE